MDVISYISNEMQQRGVKSYVYRCEHLNITSDNYFIDLRNYIYLFASQTVDLPFISAVELISPDNYFYFSKDTLEENQITKYQFFSDNLEIITRNYGIKYVPYQLEFVKITPIYDKKIR